MTGLNLANNFASVTDKTIDSQELLSLVNQARLSCDEKAVRNNDFIARIKDELEGEGYEIFVTPMERGKGGADKTVVRMTIKQAIRVAARESKAVRRALVDKLEAMQQAHIEKNKSGSGLVEYRLAKAQQLQAQALEKNIASARDLMAMFPRLGDAANQVIVATLVNPLIGQDIVPLPQLEQRYYTAGEAGKQLGVTANKIGRIANKHGLKTEQYGEFFLDKSRHSDKQVEAFRYNEEGIKALRHLIDGADAA